MKIKIIMQIFAGLTLIVMSILNTHLNIIAQEKNDKKANTFLSIKKQKSKSTKAVPIKNKSKTKLENLRPLDGAFIQLWSAEGDQKMWDEVLYAMKAAKMKTIVIQYLQHRAVVFNKETGKPELIVGNVAFSESYEQNGVNYVDPTEYILQFAEKNDMQVFIGLIFDQRFVADKQWNDPKILDLEQQTQDGINFAQRVWDRYEMNPETNAPYKSFAGWYLPSEMWNEKYSDEQINKFRHYFSEISKKCKTLAPGKPVAVSPFLNPTSSYLNASEFASRYSKFLKTDKETAGIDIVMLQDSVGAKASDFMPSDKIDSILTPFYTNLRTELNRIGVKLWANVESFNREGEGATEFSRLEKQIQVADKVLQDKNNEQIITFDFFHYMNPYGHFHNEAKSERLKDGPEYTAQERKLYCEYLKALQLSPPNCIICSN